MTGHKEENIYTKQYNLYKPTDNAMKATNSKQTLSLPQWSVSDLV